MRKILEVAIAFVFLSLFAFAQQPNASTNNHPMIAERERNACSGEHKPGDHLKCYLEFKRDPEFTNMNVRFNLQTPLAANQRGLSTQIYLGTFRKESNGVYVLDAEIPLCASGTYQITYVYAGISSVGAREYQYPSDFKDVVTIQVKSNVDDRFPDLKDVSAEPPKEEKAAAEPVKK